MPRIFKVYNGRGLNLATDHKQLNMPFPFISATPALFPAYLVPAINFHRRKSSAASDASNVSMNSTDSQDSTQSSSSTSGSVRQTVLNGHSSRLRCARCLSDLALSQQIISKGFTGRHGRAYLVSPSISSTKSDPTGAAKSTLKSGPFPNLPNTYTHRPVPRQLVTGAHTVSDISCAQCGSVLGWKYLAAEEEPQRYKVGKFILETKRVCRSNCWEGDDGGDGLGGDDDGHAAAYEAGGVGSGSRGGGGVAEIEFDSQDEDECEDLFTGVWNAQTAGKRRRMRELSRKDE